MSFWFPSIPHSLSDENGVNGLMQTARHEQILHESDSEDKDVLLSSDSSSLIYFQGAASWRSEFPI